jgi:hypothetical protein
MGWHDTLAARAVTMGRSAAEFKAGARRKANTTWPWLIVSVAVGFSVSWAWALIPAAIAAFSAFQCISAILVASRLKKIEKARGA